MPSQTFTYQTDASAGDIPAHVHYPEPDKASDKSLPIVIIFHAGGFVAGSTDLVPQNQIDALVGLGFVVVVPDYRLCPQVSLYDGPITDAKSCLAWTRHYLPHALENVGIKADPTRIAAFGHSAGASLALHLGAEANPPTAILSFYCGCAYLKDPFWSTPLAAFASIPVPEESFLNQIYEGPQALSSRPMFAAGKPNLSSPRTAWMINAIKTGTLYSSIVPDGDFDRVDPVSKFEKNFPPTYFVHGTADVFSKVEISEKMTKELLELGAQAEMVRTEGQPHVFDIMLKEEDELFKGVVMDAFRWLESHV